MIKTSFKKDNNQIVEIKVSGHAMHSKYGTDIVCAAVSTAIIVSLNALEHLNIKDNVSFELEDGYFKLKTLINDFNTNAILNNLEYTLSDLEKQFPKNIKNQKEA